MSTIHAIYENGAFRPITPVDLPEGCEVTIEPRAAEPGPGRATRPDEGELNEIYEILGRRHRSGHSDTAERHNEHQP